MPIGWVPWLALLVSPSAGVAVEGSCPNANLATLVDDYLSASEATAEGWAAKATIQSTDDVGSRVTLSITSPDGVTSAREFEAESCAVAVEAAAFVFATAIDPSIAPPEPEPEPEPEPAPEPEPEPAPDPEPDPEPEPEPQPELRPERRRLDGMLRIAAGVMGGSLPAADGSFMLLGGLRGKFWRAELIATVRLRSPASADLDANIGANIGHWAFGGRGCGVPSLQKFEFPLCGGIEGGQLFARGFGFEGAQPVQLPWGAAVFAPGIAYVPIERLAIIAEAQVGVPFNRAEIVIDNLQSLHTVGPAFGRGYLGLELRL